MLIVQTGAIWKRRIGETFRLWMWNAGRDVPSEGVGSPSGSNKAILDSCQEESGTKR